MQFPIAKHVIARLLPRSACEGCGERTPRLVRFPSCLVSAIWTQLAFQSECVLCRHATRIEVQLPRLQLGFAMVVGAENSMSLSRLCQGEHLVVEPSEGLSIDPDEDLYHEILFRTAAETMRSGCRVDWAALVGNERAWKEFLRRGGFDG